ncbi:DsrE family protein [Microbacterium sp. KRD172]|uniref:DsrE family protein n=1 Tax=Microbacterium sp. KRD172 TaxID=2729727 RepID=UPI0019D300AB|nr:DsrE family protein [Microbacterium sp. KRD172]
MADKHLLIHAYGADPEVLSTAFRVARNSARELGSGVGIHIVVQGPAVEQLTAGSSYADEIAEVATSRAIEVTACSNSMATIGVDKSELHKSVGSVPSAVAYVAQKQWEGWAYVRF